MDETERLTNELKALLKVIEQQEAKILIKITEEEQIITNDSKEPWYNQLEITQKIMRYIENQQALFLLHKDKVDTLNSYFQKVLGEAGYKLKIKDVERGGMNGEERVAFEEIADTRVAEYKIMMQHYPNSDKLKGKRLSIFRLATGDNVEEKKAIVNALLDKVESKEAETDEEE